MPCLCNPYARDSTKHQQRHHTKRPAATAAAGELLRRQPNCNGCCGCWQCVNNKAPSTVHSVLPPHSLTHCEAPPPHAAYTTLFLSQDESVTDRSLTDGSPSDETCVCDNNVTCSLPEAGDRGLGLQGLSVPLQEAGAAQHARAQPDGCAALAAQAVGHLR